MCGIKGLETKGCTKQDWAHWVEKLRALEKMLTPIDSILHWKAFFSHAELLVLQNHHTTCADPSSMADFWADILVPQGKTCTQIRGLWCGRRGF